MGKINGKNPSFNSVTQHHPLIILVMLLLYTVHLKIASPIFLLILIYELFLHLMTLISKIITTVTVNSNTFVTPPPPPPPTLTVYCTSTTVRKEREFMKKLKCTAPVGMSREIIRILLRYCSRFTGKQGKLENIWENEPAEKTFLL